MFATLILRPIRAVVFCCWVEFRFNLPLLGFHCVWGLFHCFNFWNWVFFFFVFFLFFLGFERESYLEEEMRGIVS